MQANHLKRKVLVMTILKAIILGIVQGITEFLPISSSGHLSIFQHFLGTTSDTSMMFNVFLHFGTLVAVFVVYYKTIWELIVEVFKIIKDIFTGKFSFKNMSSTRKMFFMFIISCLPLLLLLIPIGNGENLMDFFGGLSEDNDIIVEGCCFLLTGFLLLFGTYMSKKKANIRPEVNAKDALCVGFAQLIAASLPGVSRSGSTISTGMICGVEKEYMVRYSFILGIPAILAATLVEFKGAVETNAAVEILPIIIGVVISALVGFAAIKILEWLVKKDKFKFFGYYCLILGVVVIVLGALGI